MIDDMKKLIPKNKWIVFQDSTIKLDQLTLLSWCSSVLKIRIDKQTYLNPLLMYFARACALYMYFIVSLSNS